MGQNLAARTRKAVADRHAPAPPDGAPAADDVQKMANYIASLQEQIARALPSQMDAARMTRIALTALRRDPRLAWCTQRSLAGAVLTAAALGLEPGVADECWLLPEHNTGQGWECRLVVGYQGYIKRAYQSGLVTSISAQFVCERDEFEHEFGTNAFLRHRPARGDRGAIVEYYAISQLPSGPGPFEVLSPEEVEELRGGKVGPSDGFEDPQHWMERKTVVRQLTKLLPKSAVLAAVLAADERGGTDLYADRLAEREAADILDTAAVDTAPDSPPSGEPDADPAPGPDAVHSGPPRQGRGKRRNRRAGHARRAAGRNRT
ncbi:hypothetical protein GFY24_00920 [Nocardia sp. SYP-A9097]|uniref:recombinase RecT n=1 Tax=Nocardia sp. SYP-A9097 TaxID=2663237 RepID=UPI00129B2F84|nr:recombinase RecT [Nocardia sp. SYP-A9097]MRH86039.1 hypothetical protein [Nocardia sp. SYP-A9097]